MDNPFEVQGILQCTLQQKGFYLKISFVTTHYRILFIKLMSQINTEILDMIIYLNFKKPNLNSEVLNDKRKRGALHGYNTMNKFCCK